MIILIGLFGLVIGSFLNVCIYRLPLDESIAFPASHCPNCNKELKYYNLIPVFSFLFQRGKCSNCSEKISLQYPIVELLNMLIYIVLFVNFGFSIDFIFYGIISSILIVITFIDINHMIIQDKLVILVFLVNLVHKVLNLYINNIPIDIKSSLIGAAIGGGIFLLIFLVSRGGMGDGDITLMASLGFVLGWELIILNGILSFILGAVLSLILLATKIKDRKDPIPFGPFIIMAFFTTLVYGSNIISWYLNSFVYI